MTEREIFEELFKTARASGDTKGAVAACLVKGGEIIVISASSDDGLYHGEYLAIERAKEQSVDLSNCVLYSTLEPCGVRNSERAREIGDCATLIVNSGIKKVIVGALDPVEGRGVAERFRIADVEYVQVSDLSLTKESIDIFNESCAGPKHKI
jgi:pyrimidine deaminase RibD-like protein